MIADHVRRRGLPSTAEGEHGSSTGVLVTSGPPTPDPGGPAGNTGGDPKPAEQLRQLTMLHEQGVLSDTEFDRARRQVQAG